MRFIILSIFGLGLLSCQAQTNNDKTSGMKKEEMTFKVNKTDDQWKSDLTSDQYYILRQAGTERAGTGEYNLHFEDGIYHCAACNADLFASDSKFESHCGWPSFDKAIGDSTIIERVDNTLGMSRTEILCANCGGHLGHVFNDGPTETGMRYCINSGSLDFDKEEKK